MEQAHWARQLNINYLTLTVCQQGLTNPFSRWTQTHTDQGFAWRHEAVSFAAFESDTSIPRVEIDLTDSYTPASAAVRIIRVPFQVLSPGIEVTSPASESWIVEFPPSVYSLFYAIEGDPEGSDEEAWLYRLTFVPTIQAVPAEILRADAALSPPAHLAMSAEPA